MPIGPGKYDTLCTDARVAAEAKVAILIIIGGHLGSGFSVQMDTTIIPPDRLVAVLGNVADGIEKDSRQELCDGGEEITWRPI